MKQEPATDHGRISLRVAMSGNLLALANSASILLIGSPGSEIRPMYVPAYLLLIAVSTRKSAVGIKPFGNTVSGDINSLYSELSRH